MSSRHVAFEPETEMPGDGTEDSLLGTIVLLWGVFVIILLEAGRELISDGGPLFSIFGLAIIPALAALAAIAIGATKTDRLRRGALAAAGFAAIGIGTFLVQHSIAPDRLFGLGRGFIAAGAVSLLYVALMTVRLRRDLPEGRFTKLMTIGFGVWLTYAAATMALVGSVHLGVLGLLAWQVVTPLADAYVALRERFGGPDETDFESASLEEFVPVEVHSRFTPEQQEVVEGVVDFIATTFGEKWPNPTIREAIEGPAFTTYVLDKPDVVDAGRFLSQVDNLAIKLGVAEIGLDISVSGKKRGLLIQIAKPREKRGTVWFDEFIAQYGQPPEDQPFRVVLGRDSFDSPVFADIGSNTDPHMLICGTTRSGKTIMMHNILAQLFINNSPDDVQFAVIDPKRVSGTLYANAGAPHLWAPIVVDAERVPELLRRVEGEMDRRFGLLTEGGVTNRVSYNRKHPDSKIPALILLMDEVASLTGDEGVRKSYEKHVGNIAMKGGAAGVFLVLGVQRPSQRNLSENVRGLLNQRIVFKLNSLGESTMGLGVEKDDPAAMRLGGLGDGYYVLSGERVRFIGAYLPEEDDKRWISRTRESVSAAKRQLALDQANGAAPEVLAADEIDLADKTERLSMGFNVDAQIRRIVDKWGKRDIPQDMGPAPVDPVVTAAYRARLSADHNGECSDREWLVLTGLRMAVANTADAYETIVFTPEELEPFVARAADAYGYHDGDVDGDEIHRTIGRFFPDPRTGGPPRTRSHPLMRAMIEPSKYDPALVGRFAADPSTVPPIPGGEAAPIDDGPSVEDIANRAPRDF